MLYHNAKYDTPEQAEMFSESLNNNTIIDHAWNPRCELVTVHANNSVVHVLN